MMYPSTHVAQRATILGIVLCALLFSGLSALAAGKDDGALLCASNGKGEVRFLWAPPTGYWPVGGWRLQDQNGQTLADITPMAPDLMARFNDDEQELVQSLLHGLTHPESQETLAYMKPMLGFHAMSSFARGRALGVAHVLTGQPSGVRTYTLTGLDAPGAPGKVVLRSSQVDPSVATPLPPAPADLRAISASQGAALFWEPAATKKETPVIAYVLTRAADKEQPEILPTVILGASWNSTEPAFIDPLAQVGQKLTYTVRSLDAFGRESLPSETSLFMDDPEAMLPPASLIATAKPGKITLTWTSTGNPNTAGYALERSTSENGLYELLTPKALDAKTTTYTDTAVVDSLIYFYRIRAVNPVGTMGAPSGAVTAMPPNAADPPQPKNIKTTVSPIQVTLEWERADYPMAGYIVEKRSGNSTQWNRLNRRVTPERTYTDPYALEAYGTFFYRVIAVSFDNRRSKPSAEVKVSIADLSRPPAPRIMNALAENGTISLEFAPGQPEEKSASFIILRGREGQRQGEVLTNTLPAGERLFIDTNVSPGQTYWYSVVAVDKAKQESNPSDKRMVTAQTPEIPVPAAPKVRLETKPFVHVQAAFPPAPAPLLATLQRQDVPDGPWRTIVRDVSTGKAVDAHPLPTGTSAYRILYHAPNGEEGEPSPAASLTR